MRAQLHDWARTITFTQAGEAVHGHGQIEEIFDHEPVFQINGERYFTFETVLAEPPRASPTSDPYAPIDVRRPCEKGLADDAISALINLGFKEVMATKVVSAARDELGEAATLDGIIKAALRKPTLVGIAA